MGFSSVVHERTLVAAARHCCVCHRYKGVKVEVHHIIPHSQGGTDDFENAIPLCFDCHADAGHYNAKHPKGSRISPRELRLARDRWYEIVERNGIAPPDELGSWYCRYLICKDFEALHEICESDLTRIPVDKPLLVHNRVLEFLLRVLATHGQRYRHARSFGERYSSEAEYQKTYPDARRVNKTEPGLSYYNLVRVPSAGELRGGRAAEDGVVQLMLEQGIAPEEIARAVTYEDACGGTQCQEELKYRHLWGAFLACTNTRGTPDTIDSINGSSTSDPKAYGPFLTSDEPFTGWHLPAAPIPPGGTAVIPVGVILTPIGHSPFRELSRELSRLERARVQEVVHGAYDRTDLSDFRLWGPHCRPMGFRFGGTGSFQAVHTLDLSNLYAIDRYWEMGSCPHLFVVRDNYAYAGEVLAQCDGVVGIEVIGLPTHLDALIIAELEDETSELWSVEIDGSCILRDRVLMPGEEVRIPIPRGAEKMRVVGRYLQNAPSGVIRQRSVEATRRNALVSQYLADRLVDRSYG